VCVCHVSSPLSSSYIFTLYVAAEIPKLWGAPPLWGVFYFRGEEASCLYEGHVYFERNI
jgi:hypothetical protein